jgi:hypothetical protein
VRQLAWTWIGINLGGLVGFAAGLCLAVFTLTFWPVETIWALILPALLLFGACIGGAVLGGRRAYRSSMPRVAGDD